jgi:hypothetical protein
MLNKTYFQKSCFLAFRNLQNRIQVSEKYDSNRFGIRTLELTIKVQKISIFVKRVHSRKSILERTNVQKSISERIIVQYYANVRESSRTFRK